MADFRYISHEEAKEKAMKDPEYERAYRLLKPRYDIVRNIIKLRSREGITQKELAKKAGTHQSRVSKIESAELDVRLSTLIKLADALDADVKIELVSRKVVPETKQFIVMKFIASPVTIPVPTHTWSLEEKVFA